ncbi:MAG TPA: DNA translocase FtsK 4TM domain-containing protein, partial [Armatimonadota bacterium]|nr:DNA translocase FtsK 4TM domain-containing protein [Armatimonadota bacterium]
MARKGARSVSAPANKLVYETAGIVCLTLGAILLVALSSGSSGAVTALLIRGLRCGFGVGAYAVPLGVMLAGVLLIVRYEEALRVRPAGAGLPLLCAVILTFAHLPADPATRFDEEVLVSGGGVVGATLAAVLSVCFGATGAYIIAAGGALAAVAIASPKPLAVLLGPAAVAAQRLWARLRAFWARKSEERRRMRVARQAKAEPRARRVKAPRPPKPAVLDEPVAQCSPPAPAPASASPEPPVPAAPAEPPIPAWLIPPREGPALPGAPTPAQHPASPVDWSD